MSVAGEPLLVVDQLGTIEVGLVVERLAEAGARVTVATPFLHFGPSVGFTHLEGAARAALRPGLHDRADHGVRGRRQRSGRRPAMSIRSRCPDGAFTAVVAGVPGRPDLSLYAAAVATGAAVHLAGDVVAPRSAMHAYREGDNAGRAVRPGAGVAAVTGCVLAADQEVAVEANHTHPSVNRERS